MLMNHSSESREDRLRFAIEEILQSKGDDGAEVLSGPAEDASVEPGWLLHEMYEVWKRKRGPRGEAHTFKNLNRWTNRIPSLHHKLKGRLSFRRDEEDAQQLLAVMLEHWSGNDAHPALGKEKPAAAAERIARVLFGPIYGIERKEIRMVKSPGINTATFMRKQRKKAEAILIPVIDRALFGSDPTNTLAGTRLSVAMYLGKNDEEADTSGHLIYLLKSDRATVGLNYVRYLYERSFLAILFQLLKITSQEGWEIELYPGSKRKLPEWDNLKLRLWVCVSPSGERVDDYIPEKVPAVWNSDIKSLHTDSGSGFFVVLPMEHGERELRYWKYRRDNGAVSDIKKPETAMVDAHKKLIQVVLNKAKEKNGDSSSGWTVMSAEDFLKGRDLQQCDSDRGR